MPGWRKGTYVILAFNLFMLAWIISAASSGSVASGDAINCGSLSQSDCNTAQGIGTSIAVMLLIPLWAMGNIILGVLWLVTNGKKGRDCPVCGNTVKKGLVALKSCGHDFPLAGGVTRTRLVRLVQTSVRGPVPPAPR